MNLIELERALRQLRLGGIAAVLETRLRQALTNSHYVPTGYSSCAASRPASATQTIRSTTSTSLSIPR